MTDGLESDRLTESQSLKLDNLVTDEAGQQASNAIIADDRVPFLLVCGWTLTNIIEEILDGP